MRLKIGSLALLLLLFFCTDLRAQVDTIPKWELGVDLLSPFRRLRIDELNSTYGLIIKRKVGTDNALRFRTNVGFDYMPNPDVNGTNQPRSYSLSFDLGYEKQKRVRRFMHYYGADLIFRLSHSDNTLGTNVSGSNTSFSRYKGKVNGYGISAFTGGKYFIAERLSISLETSLHLIYGNVKESYTEIDGNGIDISQPITTLATNGIELKLNPISVLYLSYYF